MKVLFSGNEAIARGAYEAGVKVAAGYPGTPSTEILENLARYEGVYAQWSPNEKVAFEVGVGASVAGSRTMVTMKHVGVNVAADPLFTFAYTGVNGGFVLISADDPGMHSSQNEQDNRIYGKFAKIPVLEPSDSQEAKDYVAQALQISEDFDTPVILRITTRIAHSQSMVELTDPVEALIKPYKKNPPKYVMIPAYGRARHVIVEERRQKLIELAGATELNQMEIKDKSFGIITSGICHQYVRQAFPKASVLKLGMTYPLSRELIAKFSSQVDKVFVVEELEPFLEEAVTNMGIEVTGKELFPRIGELTTAIIKDKISLQLGIELPDSEKISTENLPPAPMRPPVLCPGCPHRAVFHTLKKNKLTVTGDIGCYTLGSLPPLEAMDTTVCMGASIGMALGMEKANPALAGKVVAVIGDSTFFHSGITGLVDMVYNKSKGTVMILDNSTTAMTGHQHHPATGQTLKGEVAEVVDIPRLVRGIGVKRVVEVDPFDLARLDSVLKEETAASEVSVIIARRACALLEKPSGDTASIDSEKCSNCRQCLSLGCPALALREGRITLNTAICTGCNLCVQVCRFSAILKAGDNNE